MPDSILFFAVSSILRHLNQNIILPSILSQRNEKGNDPRAFSKNFFIKLTFPSILCYSVAENNEDRGIFLWIIRHWHSSCSPM